MTHIRGRSTEITLVDLAEVGVCDQIGGLVYDAGVLEYFADARRRLLTADAVLVPARFRLFVAPATCDDIRSQIELWKSSPAGLDYWRLPMLRSTPNTEHRTPGRRGPGSGAVGWVVRWRHLV